MFNKKKLEIEIKLMHQHMIKIIENNKIKEKEYIDEIHRLVKTINDKEIYNSHLARMSTHMSKIEQADTIRIANQLHMIDALKKITTYMRGIENVFNEPKKRNSRSSTKNT